MTKYWLWLIDNTALCVRVYVCDAPYPVYWLILVQHISIPFKVFVFVWSSFTLYKKVKGHFFVSCNQFRNISVYSVLGSVLRNNYGQKWAVNLARVRERMGWVGVGWVCWRGREEDFNHASSSWCVPTFAGNCSTYAMRLRKLLKTNSIYILGVFILGGTLGDYWCGGGWAELEAGKAIVGLIVWWCGRWMKRRGSTIFQQTIILANFCCKSTPYWFAYTDKILPRKRHVSTTSCNPSDLTHFPSCWQGWLLKLTKVVNLIGLLRLVWMCRFWYIYFFSL